MPFQGRIAMMPVVRWAHGNRAVNKIASYVGTQILHGKALPREEYSPEKMVCTLVGLAAMLASVGFAAALGRRNLSTAWWLPPALFIYMLYITYAARSQAQYWYPYDLPHFALFGMAAVCILRRSWIPAFCLFLFDLPMRETSIYLVPLILAAAYARKQWRIVPWAAVMLLLWIPTRLYISHRFAGNPSEAGIHWDYFRHSLINPWRWGQLASAFGFLMVPFCLGFKYLDRDERFFVYGSIPGIACTGVYGIWFETRVWDEWLLPFAILLSFQALRGIDWMILSRPSPKNTARAVLSP